MTPDLVIFDCDGVVVDSELISASMLIAALRPYGVDMSLDFVRDHFLGRSYPTVLAEVRAHWGADLPESFEAEYRERLLAAFDRDLKPMPGIEDVLRRMACPYCLATSSSPARVHRTLQATGLSRWFDGRVFTASQVSRGKPEPDLFLLAADRMEAVPARCLVIEDSLPGVSAGHAAGMQVWRFTGGGHLRGTDAQEPSVPPPHRSFDSFARFFDLCPALDVQRRAG